MNTQYYIDTGFPAFPEFAPRSKVNEFFRYQGLLAANSAFFDLTAINNYGQTYNSPASWDQQLHDTPYSLPDNGLELYAHVFYKDANGELKYALTSLNLKTKIVTPPPVTYSVAFRRGSAVGFDDTLEMDPILSGPNANSKLLTLSLSNQPSLSLANSYSALDKFEVLPYTANK